MSCLYIHMRLRSELSPHDREINFKIYGVVSVAAYFDIKTTPRGTFLSTKAICFQRDNIY